MKIRNGFVSNSSSSSFIIALKEHGNKCPHCGRKDPDFIDYVEKQARGYDDETEVVAKGAEEIIRYINRNFCLSEEERGKYENGLFIKLKEYDKKNIPLAYIQISYHDDWSNQEYEVLKNNDKIEELYSSH